MPQTKSKNRPTFLVFSDDWGEHPSSCQHIFQHIAKEHKVIWVNTIGMRNMKLTLNDLHKAFIKLGKMFCRTTSKALHSHDNIHNLYVVQPFMLPFLNILNVRKFNAKSVMRSVKKMMRAARIQSPIFVSTVPNACDYIDKLDVAKKVYYCVDNFSLWPGLEQELVLEMENKLIRKCDIFIATSSALYEKLAKNGKDVQLLTHGVDVDFFSNIPDKEHPLLSDIPIPRLGYFGLFDERTNLKLVAEVAQNHPHVSFVITGKVDTTIAPLEAIGNIFFTDAIPYDQLPMMIKGWQACFLPYHLNSLTDSISPLKIKEYLATGKPVISTPLPEVIKLGKYIAICNSSEEWGDTINKILYSNELKLANDRLSFLKNETWEKKSIYFLEYILGY